MNRDTHRNRTSEKHKSSNLFPSDAADRENADRDGASGIPTPVESGGPPVSTGDSGQGDGQGTGKVPGRPILFLDFDGVLNDWRWFRGDERRSWRAAHAGDTIEVMIARHAGDLDPDRIVHLNAIIERTGAVVMLHTSWRHVFAPDLLRKALKMRGFRGDVLGVTDPEWRDRSDSIRDWLRRNPDVGPWAVLDDEPLHKEPIVGDRFVCTFDPDPCGAGGGDDGLSGEHVERVVALLTGGAP